MDQHPQGVSRGAAVGFNFNYITSGGGVLKILEVLFGLICWAVLAATQGSWCVDDCTSGRAFGLVVTIAAWILTLLLLIIYASSLHATSLSGLPWLIIEFFFNGFWSIFYFIAAVVVAAFSQGMSGFVASAVFGFFTSICYMTHSILAFRDWKGHVPCGSSSSEEA